MVLLSSIVKKSRDIPIKQKLFLCISLLIIIPLIITGFYINNQFTNITIKKSIETSLQVLKQTRQNFENMIADTVDLSIKILSKDKVQELSKIGSNNAGDTGKIALNILGYIDEETRSKTYINSICLSRNNEILLQKGGTVYEEDATYTKKAVEMEGIGFWTTAHNLKFYSGDNDSQPVISFYRAIIDFNLRGNILAVERISINEEAICSFYSDINPYKDSSIFLVDSNGRVLSSPEKKIIGAEYGAYEYIKRAMQEKEGSLFTYIENVRNIVLFYKINDTGWYLIQTIPEKSFVPFKTTINAVLVIAIALCILFGVIFSFIQNNLLVKPLSRLLKEMDKLRKGNFDVILDTGSKDEIGEINRGFTEMSRQLKEMINDVYISKIKQREAELIALEAQINPHFLYNTLDSIHWLAVKNRDYDVSEQIEALSEIFKHVLNRGREIVTIEDEIDFLNHYMFIQKAKYQKRINLIINVDDELKGIKTPKLILQPLVENAILHGLEQKLEGGTIRVDIEKRENLIRYVVSDNGKGVNEDRISEMLESSQQSHNVFALKNIDERIKLKYGKEYGLKFSSKVDQGTIVEILIPLIE